MVYKQKAQVSQEAYCVLGDAITEDTFKKSDMMEWLKVYLREMRGIKWQSVLNLRGEI